MSTSVTFDSNVWETLVDPKKRTQALPVFTELFVLITSGVIRPFFFEGLATMETIPRQERKEKIGSYRAGFSITVDGQVESSSRGSDAPELSPYLRTCIPAALNLGFRFTRIPRIGAPSLDIPDQYWAPDQNFGVAERQQRSFECARFIEGLHAGRRLLLNQLDAGAGGIVGRTSTDCSVATPKYAKGVAEWVDGDALAANYGYGIDYFCTQDKASGAGSSSIFYREKLEELQKQFPVNVVSPKKLVEILGNQNPLN